MPHQTPAHMFSLFLSPSLPSSQPIPHSPTPTVHARKLIGDFKLYVSQGSNVGNTVNQMLALHKVADDVFRVSCSHVSHKALMRPMFLL